MEEIKLSPWSLVQTAVRVLHRTIIMLSQDCMFAGESEMPVNCELHPTYRTENLAWSVIQEKKGRIPAFACPSLTLFLNC